MSEFVGNWLSATEYMFVNKEGKRFVNEYSERDVLSKAALEQTDKLFFIICDNGLIMWSVLFVVFNIWRKWHLSVLFKDPKDRMRTCYNSSIECSFFDREGNISICNSMTHSFFPFFSWSYCLFRLHPIC